MDERVQKLSQFQEGLLILISLTPLLCIYYGLFYQNNASLTLLLFHFSLITFAILFKLSFSNTTSFDYFQGECKGFLEQLINGFELGGFICFAISAALVVSILNFRWIFGLLSGLGNKTCTDFAMSCDTWTEPMLFAVYFSFINPIVEESYWNVFLLKSFPDKLTNRVRICVLYSFYHMVIVI